jgi:hypothetical protein
MANECSYILTASKIKTVTTKIFARKHVHMIDRYVCLHAPSKLTWFYSYLHQKQLLSIWMEYIPVLKLYFTKSFKKLNRFYVLNISQKISITIFKCLKKDQCFLSSCIYAIYCQQSKFCRYFQIFPKSQTNFMMILTF